MNKNKETNAKSVVKKVGQYYLLAYDFCKAGHDIRDKASAVIVERVKNSNTPNYRCRQCHNDRMRERVRAKGATPQKNFIEPNSDLGALVRLIRNNPEVIKQLTEIAEALTAEQE
jgi:hypothetical protein